MLSFTINHLLEVFENHIALSGAKAGDTRLYFTESSFSIGNHLAEASFRNLQHANRFSTPLTSLELNRLKTLDRKAKGGLLTEQEDAEFEGLLEIQRYYSIKQLKPSLSHTELLFQVRA
jgi:hypothetical protein